MRGHSLAAQSVLPILLSCLCSVQSPHARTVLEKSGVQWEAIEFYPMTTDRVWARDFAPLFVKNPAGELAAVKWRFNGWAKYDNHLRDEAAGLAIAELLSVDFWQPGIVLRSEERRVGKA